MPLPNIATYFFEYSFRALLILLPFMTVLSVFTRERLGIPGFAFIKEILLFFTLLSLAYYHFSGKKKMIWSRYDIAIFAYIIILIIITVFTTGVSGIVYGWRYDFSFLIAFFVLYHGHSLLIKPVSYYLRLFLISGGIMICISMLLKWPFSEDLLLYLGYSGNPSNWQFGSSIPIFHGVDGANVRRFQWLLDGPNTMWAFLLMYVGVFIYFLRNKKDWYFLLWMVVIGFVVLIVYTYSRSALLGFIWWIGIIILFLLPNIYKKYRLQFFSILILSLILIWAIFFQYSGNMKALIQRWWSTNGHLERMKTGIERFIEYPLWQWLGSAGPAYRYVQNLKTMDRQKIEELDRYSIPESWYIQQLIEWWIFGFLAFISIIILISFWLYRTHIFLFWMFISICIMNFFLHTFESSILSLLLFSIVGLILWHHHARKS